MTDTDSSSAPAPDGVSDHAAASASVGVAADAAGVRAGPDVSEISLDGWPPRPAALASGIRQRKYQAVVRQSVLDAIHGHGRSCTAVEVCGVLVGNVFRDESGPYLHVNSCIRGDRATGSAAQVTFTAETWSAIQKTMDEEHAEERIVGWYHTHPGFGIFLSGMDLFIQDHFFNLPWQVAFVYDPLGGDEGMFFWKEGKADRQPFLIEAELLRSHVIRGPQQNAPTLAEMEAEHGPGVLDPAVASTDRSASSKDKSRDRSGSRSGSRAQSRSPLFAQTVAPPRGSGDSADSGDVSDHRWSGSRATDKPRSRLPLWILGVLAFALSFACTLWFMYTNREVVIIPHHVDHVASRPHR